MATPILFIHGAADLGGAERELLAIVERLASYGYAGSVVLGSEGVFYEELRRRRIQTSCSPMPPWRKLWGVWQRASASAALRRLIEQAKPALLHVNDIWWVPQTLQAASGLGIPTLAHARQEIEPEKVRRYRLHQVDAVVAVSRQVQRSLQQGGVEAARLSTIYSGLGGLPDRSGNDLKGLRVQLGIPERASIIGTVANLFPRKGYEVMLRALPQILAEIPDVHYVVVGGGNQDYEHVLRTLARSLQIDDHVHFVGAQPAVYPYLAFMDLYVHPAVMEGFGIAVLEAMAMGKAVVATKTGGVPEIVVEQETGLLVEANSADGLAAAAVQLLKDPMRRDRMGRAGLERVRSCFTADSMMRSLTELYGTCLNAHRHPSHVSRV